MKRVLCLFVVLAASTAVLAAEAKVKIVKVDGDNITVTFAEGGKDVTLNAKDAKVAVGKDGQEREVPADAKPRILKAGTEVTITFDREKKTISKILVMRAAQR